MEFNKETQLLQNEIRKFARDVIAEKVDEFDKQGMFPKENIKKLAEMGILGSTIPEVYGGCNLDTISLLVCLEEISKVCPSTALILLTHNILFSYPVVKFGKEDQKKKYLAGAATGDIVGGFAEYSTNELKIEKNQNAYSITGQNHILLNGISSGPFILFVEVNNKIDALIIDNTTTALTRNKKDNTIGMKSAGITQIVFENCNLPDQNRIGNEGDGKIVLDEIYSLANLGFSAINLGICQAGMENAIKYARERVQFGEPIINFGMVREMIADMATSIEAIRLLTYDAAMLRDNNKDFSRVAAIARYLSNQVVADITTNAIQVYGGYGYMKDYPVERYFRDSQVSRVLCCSSIQLKELIVQKTI
jgi:alkylation response protein AidB-like acyl-CoA dehydrogenase